MRRLFFAALLFALTRSLSAQPAPSVMIAPSDMHNDVNATPLLVLGTYHLAGGGQDAVKLEVGDIRNPQKQRELSELLDRLEAFRPTKILIESPYFRSKDPANYQQYLAGTYKLSANEIDQVAFALARRLGLATIHPVDYPMWMDGRVPQEIGQRKRVAAKPADEPAPAPPPLPESARILQDKIQMGTVLDVFRYINSPEYIRADHAFYVRMLHPDPTTDDLYEGANALTFWAKRNLRILSNTYRVIEPGDRILLLIGSGHLTALQQWAQAAPDLVLMDTPAYLR